VTAPEPIGSISNPIPRRAARVLLIDGLGRLLMFRGFDPANPGPRYWFTVGGGLDEGESAVAGAARELHEETGLHVSEESIGSPVWQETTTFPYDGRWYRQRQEFFAVRVPSWEVTTDGFDVEERRSVDGFRWWSVEDLAATTERFYPKELPDLVRELIGADGPGEG
jgi:8-oxo-dGTP pyrophosphatase MutT (NUDIX family)